MALPRLPRRNDPVIRTPDQYQSLELLKVPLVFLRVRGEDLVINFWEEVGVVEEGLEVVGIPPVVPDGGQLPRPGVEEPPSGFLHITWEVDTEKVV